MVLAHHLHKDCLSCPCSDRSGTTMLECLSATCPTRSFSLMFSLPLSTLDSCPPPSQTPVQDSRQITLLPALTACLSILYSFSLFSFIHRPMMTNTYPQLHSTSMPSIQSSA